MYRPSIDPLRRDKEVIDILQEVVTKHSRWGFWKCYHWMRFKGHKFNHKKVWRVYKSLGLNLPRRKKKRIAKRIKQPLAVLQVPDKLWSMDFMSDPLSDGRLLRTFNVIDDYNREGLTIDVDLSLPSERVIRSLEQVIEWRIKPSVVRADNGPENIAQAMID